MAFEKLPGIYQAEVVADRDPEGRFRAKVRLTFLDPPKELWAECCAPIEQRYTMAVAVPYIGQTVWVIFEAGDLRRPVWMGSAITAVDVSPALPR
ncbi:phage baseplate assembly protein V [Mesorhizobium sp. SP-1A]|uniref:phage baseplate assembly protein V n=1 Tax=Mesorhizobium sp. SP-1A TaxID=3077840 RepID=UPI0028F73930|nr:phage baseplate assembly protein V [Mesorhizobium sp. SP-1A]